MVSLPNRAKLASLFQKVCATQEKFAAALTEASGVLCSQQTVMNWLRREKVPSGWVRQIVAIADGKVEAFEIRPDLYPAPE